MAKARPRSCVLVSSALLGAIFVVSSPPVVGITIWGTLYLAMVLLCWSHGRWKEGFTALLIFYALAVAVAVGSEVTGVFRAILFSLGAFMALAVLTGYTIEIFEKKKKRKVKPSALSMKGSYTHGYAVFFLPDGRKVNQIRSHEIGMGGPLICHYLLSDGVFIESAGEDLRFSPDGNYMVSYVPGGSSHILLVDFKDRALYRYGKRPIHHLGMPRITNEGLDWGYLNNFGDPTGFRDAVTFSYIMNVADKEALVPYKNLWIPPSMSDMDLLKRLLSDGYSLR